MPTTFNANWAGRVKVKDRAAAVERGAPRLVFYTVYTTSQCTCIITSYVRSISIMMCPYMQHSIDSHARNIPPRQNIELQGIE